MPVTPPVFRVFRDLAGAWRVHLVGGNGEVMLSSEAYDSHDNATRAARRLSELRDITFVDDDA